MIGEEANIEGGAGASHAGGVASEDIVSGSIVDLILFYTLKFHFSLIIQLIGAYLI